MSDTDKTRPFWVQMHDPYNKGWREEAHNHANGICDIETSDPRFPWRNRWHCNFWPSAKANHSGIWGRPTRTLRCYVREETRRERVAWRNLRNRMIKGEWEAAEESPLTYNHRHSALWDAY